MFVIHLLSKILPEYFEQHVPAALPVDRGQLEGWLSYRETFLSPPHNDQPLTFSFFASTFPAGFVLEPFLVRQQLNLVAWHRQGCCSNRARGKHTDHRCVAYIHTYTRGHTDQHRHTTQSQRDTDSLNRLLLFPSLTIQIEGLVVEIYLCIQSESLWYPGIGTKSVL